MIQVRRVRLSEIPPEFQRIYNIGPEVDADVSYATMGGTFTFLNNDGDTVSADAVEFTEAEGLLVKKIA